jgi:hypothetical protein
MQGRYGNVTASAQSSFISPGLLRQQHARWSYPNPITDILINNESIAKKPARRYYSQHNTTTTINNDNSIIKAAMNQHKKRPYRNPNTAANGN